MVHGELGRHEIKCTVWNREINFWEKLESPDKLSCVVLPWLNYRNEATQWHFGIKQINKLWNPVGGRIYRSSARL